MQSLPICPQCKAEQHLGFLPLCQLTKESLWTRSQTGGCGRDQVPLITRAEEAVWGATWRKRRADSRLTDYTHQSNGCWPPFWGTAFFGFWSCFLGSTGLSHQEGQLPKKAFPGSKTSSSFSNWAPAKVIATSDLLSFELKLKLWYLFLFMKKPPHKT